MSKPQPCHASLLIIVAHWFKVRFYWNISRSLGNITYYLQKRPLCYMLCSDIYVYGLMFPFHVIFITLIYLLKMSTKLTIILVFIVFHTSKGYNLRHVSNKSPYQLVIIIFYLQHCSK